MSGCLMAGAVMIALAPGGSFTLEWQHSVERQSWREHWQVTDAGLVLRRAAVKGSGAGMEPGPDGRFEEGWWIWEPALPPRPEVVLAASGATTAGWRICGDPCVTVGAEAGEALRLSPCPG